MKPRAIAVFGTGRLAGRIAPALARKGWPVAAICSRESTRARNLARRTRGARALTDPAEAAAVSRLLLLAVPDRAIEPLATRLAAAPLRSWRGRTVLHHAGALGPDALGALAALGASTGVLHPLQVIGPSRSRRPFPPGTRARVEGAPAAVRSATGICRSLGLEPIRLPGTPDARGRLLYHAAAALASNDLVALLAEAADLLVRLGLPREEALDALVPLARGTIDRIVSGGIEGALTGPVARGDAETLEGHLAALAAGPERAREVHRLLSARLLDMSRLPAARRRAIARLLARGRGRKRGV